MSRITMGRCRTTGTTIPTLRDEKLNLWLDSEQTGATLLHGAYPNFDAAVPCGPAQACENVADVAQMSLARDLRIQPNPARDVLYLRWPRGEWTGAAQVVVRDASGRELHTASWWGGATALEVGGWPRGMVLVTVVMADGSQVTRRVILD